MFTADDRFDQPVNSELKILGTNANIDGQIVAQPTPVGLEVERTAADLESGGAASRRTRQAQNRLALGCDEMSG